MDIRLLLSLTIMWSFTIVYCRNLCASSSQNVENIRGLYQQNVDLECNISQNCDRVFWKRSRKGGKSEDISEKCTNCDYKVTNHEVNGTSVLHIYNISDNVEGVYTCHCQWMIPNSKILTNAIRRCYNLTLYSLECGMNTNLNRKRTLTFNGNHLDHTLETLDANINDVLTITCLNDGKKQTNCSELEHPFYDIPLRSSDTWCHFGCMITESNATCEVNIILNVTEELFLPSSTLMDTYSKSLIPSSYETPDSSTNAYQGIYTTEEFLTDFLSSSEPYTTNILTTSLELENLSSTIPLYGGAEQSTNTQLKTSFEHLTTNTLIPISEEHSKEENKLNNALDQIIFQNKLLVTCVISVIFMLSIITLQCVYITVTGRPCFRMCSHKDEWINPIYGSSVNDRATPCATPCATPYATPCATPYAETEIPGMRMCGVTRHDQSLPCLDVVSIQERRQFHSLGSLNITENKEPSWFKEKYKHNRAGSERDDGLVSNENKFLFKKVDSKIDWNENIFDLDRDNVSSDVLEGNFHPNNRVKVRKERLTSLHIYEDANIYETP
ncbi:hypothetical protein HOLleu_24624 [Holothuria leucospilota]|uniref:Uncharacterized protein n=1 Tax=Holothuria leucospilota TaxID=206669 RepID=A0A9Q1BRF6_HOLLE|nr:hypothetical protein HOLleu_24624 [Holothuria leucospilota]